GSGVVTLGLPGSKGVPEKAVSDTLVAIYNDIESVEMLFNKFENEIAAVIIEPVAGNMGVVAPKNGFLQGLRDLTTEFGAVLIFDEVITGFRVARGGAQE
ncbi:MAG TPA: aminotransferase class III-fold pyridoxal phosphate-dependent enzyme, partial [Bacteroidetes bacterium]|nr:aminotransferase class III-fold pyridoxal phosphate-dependent enzyme [Bacteroidota bacterium]